MSSMSLSDFMNNIIVAELQELETAVFNALPLMDMSEWSGYQLEQIGALINVERLGLSDDDYRIKIIATAAANSSDGNYNDVLTALKLITDATDVSVDNLGSASVVMTTDGVLGTYLQDNLRGFMEATLAAGVELTSIINAGNADSFTFSDAAGTPVVGKGFDNVAGTSNGGKFNYIIA